MLDRGRFFVGVTGAQGVGKSTFCRNLHSQLQDAGRGDVRLLDGLGTSVAAMGVPLGSGSTPQTIIAVWTVHLEREAAAPDGVIVLDRCIVDALAYTRALRLGSDLERRLFEQVAVLVSGRLAIVLHLRLSPFFLGKGAAHESPALRSEVAKEIDAVLRELRPRQLDLNADSDDAVDRAVRAVLEALDGR